MLLSRIVEDVPELSDIVGRCRKDYTVTDLRTITKNLD
jgi:hypothetical protein